MKNIRPYDSKLQAISLNEIKKLSGEPNEVRYFQDQSYNQIILVYHVNSTTDLKWVLPIPDNQNINSKVDHISVYTHIENQAIHQKSVAEIIFGDEVR